MNQEPPAINTLSFQQVTAKTKGGGNESQGRPTSVPADTRLIKDQEDLERSYNSLHCISTMVFSISFNSSILPPNL